MKTKLNLIQTCLLAGVLLELPAIVQAQFTSTTNHAFNRKTRLEN